MKENKDSAAISPDVIKFFIALGLLSALTMVIENFSSEAAWALVIILLLGVLLNNPAAIGLINLGGNALDS